MNDLFIDTSYLIAAVNPRDSNHNDAIKLKGALASSAAITTNHVVGECWTFARGRFGHAAAIKLVDALRCGERYRIHHVERELEERAVEWLRIHDGREYSFVDAVSFQLMKEQTIHDALAFDADFHAAGFRTIVP